MDNLLEEAPNQETVGKDFELWLLVEEGRRTT